MNTRMRYAPSSPPRVLLDARAPLLSAEGEVHPYFQLREVQDLNASMASSPRPVRWRRSQISLSGRRWAAYEPPNVLLEAHVRLERLIPTSASAGWIQAAEGLRRASTLNTVNLCESGTSSRRCSATSICSVSTESCMRSGRSSRPVSEGTRTIRRRCGGVDVCPRSIHATASRSKRCSGRGFRHRNPLDVELATGAHRQTVFVDSPSEQRLKPARRGCGCGVTET